MSDRELATVLAALRYWQLNVIEDEVAEDLNGHGSFEDHSPLDADEIDDLCERLNCGGG